MTVRLESGDILLFGGEARDILHSVDTIHENTCPRELMELQAEMTPLAPSAAWRARPPAQSFRMNLTYRHAPELLVGGWVGGWASRWVDG